MGSQRIYRREEEQKKASLQSHRRVSRRCLYSHKLSLEPSVDFGLRFFYIYILFLSISLSLISSGHSATGGLHSRRMHQDRSARGNPSANSVYKGFEATVVSRFAELCGRGVGLHTRLPVSYLPAENKISQRIKTLRMRLRQKCDFINGFCQCCCFFSR